MTVIKNTKTNHIMITFLNLDKVRSIKACLMARGNTFFFFFYYLFQSTQLSHKSSLCEWNSFQSGNDFKYSFSDGDSGLPKDCLEGTKDVVSLNVDVTQTANVQKFNLLPSSEWQYLCSQTPTCTGGGGGTDGAHQQVMNYETMADV